MPQLVAKTPELHGFGCTPPQRRRAGQRLTTGLEFKYLYYQHDTVLPADQTNIMKLNMLARARAIVLLKSSSTTHLVWDCYCRAFQFGPISILMDLFQPFQTYLDLFGTIWTFLDIFGPIFRTISTFPTFKTFPTLPTFSTFPTFPIFLLFLNFSFPTFHTFPALPTFPTFPTFLLLLYFLLFLPFLPGLLKGF